MTDPQKMWSEELLAQLSDGDEIPPLEVWVEDHNGDSKPTEITDVCLEDGIVKMRVIL